MVRSLPVIAVLALICCSILIAGNTTSAYTVPPTGTVKPSITASTTASGAGSMTAKDWNEKGIALYWEEKDSEAIECYDKAIAVDPTYFDAWNNKAFILSGLGRYDEAIVCWDRAIALKPTSAETWYNKGGDLYAQNKYGEAIVCYDKAIALDPTFAKAWNNKGKSLEKEGKTSEAIMCYDRAIALDPTHANYQNNRNLALAALPSPSIRENSPTITRPSTTIPTPFATQSPTPDYTSAPMTTSTAVFTGTETALPSMSGQLPTPPIVDRDLPSGFWWSVYGNIVAGVSVLIITGVASVVYVRIIRKPKE